MQNLILHHFDASPFAEKARLAMGLKQLTWHSVEIPMIMPKPDLMPLTGGYRKTPVLQTGAEIYCDTSLILKVIDQQHDKKLLFPHGSSGLAAALSLWSDASFFQPGAALSMALNPNVPEEVLQDRKAFFNFMDFNELQSSAPHMLGQFLAQVEMLEWQLSDERLFLTGNTPNATDILSYFPLWMAINNVPGINEHLVEFSHTLLWFARLQNLGHGQRLPMTAPNALALAKESMPSDDFQVKNNPEKHQRGDTVRVVPTDYGAVEVEGVLIGLNHQQITLRRDLEDGHHVNTHFPRLGYQICAV